MFTKRSIRKDPSTGIMPSATRGYRWSVLVVGVAILGAIMIISCGVGAVYIPPGTVVRILLSHIPFLGIVQDWPESWDIIIWSIRIPRIMLTAIVGGSLAVSGATYQGLFRNPLADPYLIGVAAGAGLGATIILITPVSTTYFGISILPVAAFMGALGAVGIAYVVSVHSRGLPLTTLILAGVAISSIAGAATSLLMLISDPDIKPLLVWLLGGFETSEWSDLRIVLPYFIVGTIVVLVYARVLNIFQLDEEQAKHLGVNVEKTKLVLIVSASLVTAAAVSVSGLIGFVGLIAPHAVRLLWGPDHRFLLPMSILVGAVFLIIADLVARTALVPRVLPVGVVTAFCGGPFFLYILHQARKRFI